MAYNFVEFNIRGSGFEYIGIRVYKSYITITKTALLMLKDSQRVSVKFDKENDSIMLCPKKDNSGYSIKTGKLACSIGKQMKQGIYNFVEEIDEGIIFKFL